MGFIIISIISCYEAQTAGIMGTEMRKLRSHESLCGAVVAIK